MSETVYLVTTGAYSDYDVCGAFSTREKAEQAVMDVFGEMWEDDKFAGGRIEEYEIDPVVVGPTGEELYVIRMLRDGDVRRAMRAYETEHFRQDAIDPKGFTAYVWARDKEHAIKIANERRAVLLATEGWHE